MAALLPWFMAVVEEWYEPRVLRFESHLSGQGGGRTRMRLASFRAGGQNRFGIVSSTGLIDLTERVDAPDLKALVGLGHSAIEPFSDASSDWSVEEVEWQPPIPNPTHIIGIGLNTKSHFEETSNLMGRTPGDYPPYPRLFMRSPFSQVGHGQALVIPSVSERLDYEGEIALIVGRECRYVESDRAMENVAGYTCYNDGSVRDFQTHSNQVTAGKNFAGSGACGPWLVTAEDVTSSDLTLSTRVNGELRQTLRMDDLIFSFAEIVAYVSTIFALQPGDVILTGSPAGIGALSGNWLKAGDTVEVEVPAIGILANSVTNEVSDQHFEAHQRTS